MNCAACLGEGKADLATTQVEGTAVCDDHGRECVKYTLVGRVSAQSSRVRSGPPPPPPAAPGA